MSFPTVSAPFASFIRSILKIGGLCFFRPTSVHNFVICEQS